MAVGSVENLTGEISYSREHELTAYDDILTITSATINLLKPAGDLMLMQGNDTVTITESTIIGDTGVGLLLGSGDDTLTIQNSEIKSRISLASGNDHVIISGSAQSVVTLTALDPDQTSIETEEDLTTLSMGDGDDVLELCAILQGNGVINFGSGSDTLIFNAGTLNNTGGIANLNNLTVTNLGGTTYRDLTLVNAGNRIEWNGNLVGSDNTKWIIIDAVTDLSLADVSFITANNVVSNLGFKVTNRTFTQTDGGTWEISGRADDVAFSADNSEVTLYNMVLTENKTGLVGNNTDWNLNESNISNHKEHGAVFTGGSLEFHTIEVTENLSRTDKQGGGVWLQDVTISGSSIRVNRNSISASLSGYIVTASANSINRPSGTSMSAMMGTAAASGGGFYTDESIIYLDQISFDNNVVAAEACCGASAKAYVTSYASNDDSAVFFKTFSTSYAVSAVADATAHAVGGGWYATHSELILNDASFSRNIASASVSASAFSYSDARVKVSGATILNLFVTSVAAAQPSANAWGGGFYSDNSTISMEHVSFDGNTAESTADFSSYTLAYILGTAGHNPRVMTSSDEPYNQIITDDWSTASVQMNPLYESPTARALGGGGYIQNSSLQLVDATFSNNIASAQATSGAHASAAGGGLWMAGVRDTNLTSVEFIANKALSDQIAQGGAIYLNEGSLTLSSGIFSGNQVSGGNFDNAKGGAIYAASMILNVSDTVFTNNTAKGGVTQGGALFITNNSKLTYTISDNAAALRKTVTCSGNTASEGGFLYLENSTADFVIGSNTKLMIADSIAGSGTITKSGADMEISAAIADSNIRWTVATGLLELSTVARTINLNNWTIGTDAMLRLSALNDTVNMSTDKKIGILDLGGGSDVINTGGYSLSDGQLLVSTLTFTGGGHVSSEISTRTEDASFDITLANVVLDSNISGGNGDDIIRITQESTVGGIMNLGDGDNRITGTADVTFRSGLTLGKSDDTLSLTNATFASAVTLGDGNNSLTATGKAQFSGDVTGGKGRDTFTSKEITFDKKLDLGDGLNSITATGNAEFKGQVTLGKDKDALNFSDVVFENTLSLGDGDNTLTSTGEASFTSVSAGCGNDVFNLSSAGFSGALDLGDGDNSITVTSSLTCFDSVTAGAGNDTINLTGSDNVSTFSGMVDLGLGENYLYIEGNVTDNIDFMIHEGGRTTAVVYRGASINGKTVSVYSRPDANLKALTLDWSSFSGDEALDKVRILISSDATFSSYEYSIELYNRVTDFTINVEEGYFYQLQANDEDGWAQRYLDDTIAPDQVGGLTWSGDQARWDVTHDNWGGNGVKQYHVELSRDAGFNDVVESATVTTTEYAFTGITEGNYYWRVRAEDFTGNLGDWSETASVFVDLTAPTAPRGLTSTSGDYSVTLSWSAASDSGSGVALYEYRIATDSGFASITVSGESSSISDVTVNDLVYGTYYWQVRAIDNSGNVGQWSLYKTFSIADTIAPTAPGQLDYQLDGNSITLDWLASSDDTDGSGLKEYRIEFSNQSDFSQIIFSRTSTSTRITVDELSGGNYFCRVSAVDQSGNVSAWSNIQNFQIEGSVQSQTPSRSDINGNGVSDVLFQYTGGDYQLGFWLDGTNNWQGQGIPESADWDVIGAYDMSSDGKADVVMLGNVTVSGIRGAFVGYRKNGDMSSWENISYLTNAEGVDWQVKVGNLTGNAGQNSILWHAPELGAVGVWTDGTDNWVSLGAGYDRNWEMIGAGDFDGDGADSILFSYANGAKYYALDLDQTATELGVSDSGWEVRAIGDFRGDGRDDIIAFNAATGLVAKWENGNSDSWSSLGQLDAADWFIAGTGDYNGDGTDDLLVRQYSTGMLGYYADADLSKWNEMGRGVDMNWAVIA